MKFKVWWLLLLFPSWLRAYEPLCSQFGVQNGLNANAVYQIYNASNGLLYFGTDNGLFVYNGLDFKQINFGSTLTTSIAFLQEDSKGTIWCMNFSGQIFYLKNNKLNLFNYYKLFNKANYLASEIVINDDILWVCSKNEIAYFNLKDSSHAKVLTLNDNLFFVSIGKHKNKIYAFSTDNNIWSFTINGYERLFKLPLPEVKFVSTPDGLILYSKGQNNRQFYKINELNKLTRLSLDNYVVNNYLLSAEFVNQSLCFCTNNGLISNGNVWFKGKRVSDIVADYQKNLWVSTLEDGVYKISYPYSTVIDMPVNKSYTVVKAHQNNLLVGSSDGSIKVFKDNYSLTKDVSFGVKNEVQFLRVEPNGNVLSSYGLFNIYNNQKKNYSFGRDACRVENNDFLITSNFILTSVVGQNLNNTKLPVISGLYKYNIVEGGYYGYTLRNQKAKAVAYLPKKKYKYVAYNDNLYVYDSVYNFKILSNDENKPIIASKLITIGDTLFALTSFDGLQMFIEDKYVGKVTIQNSANKPIKDVCIYNQRLYLLTNNDILIYKLNESGKYSLSSTLQNLAGQQSIEFYNNALLSAGRLGLVETYNPDDYKVPLPKLSLNSINSLKVNGSNYIDYKNRSVSIDFSLVDFSGQTAYIKSILISGKDTLAENISKYQQSVQFSALNHGSYIFILEALDASGNPLVSSQKLKFEIATPFWFNPFYIVVFILIITLSVMLIFRFSLSRLRKRQELQKKVVVSQLASLRAQMNPHFLYNVLNSIQGLIYENKKNDAIAYLNKFSDLMRNALSTSNSEFVSIKEEIVALNTYLSLESFRFDPNEFHFTLSDKVGSDNYNCKIPAFIIQPYVENAIKHGLLHRRFNRVLGVTLEMQNQKLIVEIIDNGIGRKASEAINSKKINKPKSFATSAISQRLALLHELYKIDIKVDIQDLETDGEAVGTLVKIIIPVIYE